MSFSYESILSKLKAKENLTFTRWGDGEWICALKVANRGNANCDGHEYIDGLSKALRLVLKSSPEYYMGMQPLAQRVMGEVINRYLEVSKVDIDWVDTEVFHNASIEGKFLEPFKDALKDREVIMVAPHHLSALGWPRIPVDSKNCWYDSRSVIKLLHSHLSQTENQVVLFCSSMAANVWIDVMYDAYGDKHTFLDMGSVFDVYCNKPSRKYHHKMLKDNPNLGI